LLLIATHPERSVQPLRWLSVAAESFRRSPPALIVGQVLGRDTMERAQCCRVHFMCNALAYAGKTQRRIVSAWIGTAFAQTTRPPRASNGAKSLIRHGGACPSWPQ
jgi:hypothetical protein